jgi:ethanolamine utilization protein EutQ (cupin superfamily)
MYKCVINREFIDRHTGGLITAGAVELSEERIKEIQNVDKTLITVLGKIEVEEPIEEVVEEPIEEVEPPKPKTTRKTTK